MEAAVCLWLEDFTRLLGIPLLLSIAYTCIDSSIGQPTSLAVLPKQQTLAATRLLEGPDRCIALPCSRSVVIYTHHLKQGRLCLAFADKPPGTVDVRRQHILRVCQEPCRGRLEIVLKSVVPLYSKHVTWPPIPARGSVGHIANISSLKHICPSNALRNQYADSSTIQ